MKMIFFIQSITLQVRRKWIFQFTLTRQIIGLFILLTVPIFYSFSQSHIPSSGASHSSIEAEIDGLVTRLMHNRVAGMTVAVTVDGRLVHSKGYGYADYENRVPMSEHHRSRIGSVSKVLTAAGVMKLAEEKPWFGLNTKVHYANGVLSHSDYTNAILRSIKRHYPIIAIAISPSDKVYTWYENGMVSVGTSWDLDAHQINPYSLPPGQTVANIIDIAISPRSSKVFVWYDDGSLSSGTSQDLDKYFYEQGPDRYQTAKDREKTAIVGIGMGQANNQTRTYVWYDDGTFSIGDSKNFVKYAQPKSYRVGSGKSRYDIRSMAVTKNNRVYAWFSDGEATAGNIDNLSVFRPPYSYTSAISNPDISEKLNWYAKMEMRHLLSHTSGLRGNGDGHGIRAMYQMSEDERAGDRGHKYYLSTRKIYSEPGEEDSYSNRGLGLCGEIIGMVSGVSYGEYLRDHVFAPIGLRNIIVPNDHAKDMFDSYYYKRTDGAFERLSWEYDDQNYKYVSGAGGWAASARSLARFMVATDKINNHSDVLRASSIDLMERRPFSTGHAIGWGYAHNGKVLSHNGAIDGGRAQIIKYKEGYSLGGFDLGNINVAICANIRFSESNGNGTYTLAENIAKVAGKNREKIPADLDLFKARGEITHHQLPSKDFSPMFNLYSSLGYTPEWIDGYSVGGNVFYNISWRPASAAWKLLIGLTGRQYQNAIDTRGDFNPVYVDSHTQNGQVRYNVILQKDAAPVFARHALNYAQHEEVMETAAQQGLEPINISVVSVGGQLSYTVLYRNTNYGGWKIKSQIKESEYQNLFNEYESQGLSPVYLSAYKHNGEVYFSAIFAQRGGGQLRARHSLSVSDIQREFSQALSSGYQTQMITAFDGASSQHRFAALWRKP